MWMKTFGFQLSNSNNIEFTMKMKSDVLEMRHKM